MDNSLLNLTYYQVSKQKTVAPQPNSMHIYLETAVQLIPQQLFVKKTFILLLEDKAELLLLDAAVLPTTYGNFMNDCPPKHPVFNSPAQFLQTQA